MIERVKEFMHGLFTQILLMCIIVGTPIIWYKSLETMYLNSFINFGLMLVIVTYSYVKLPIDLIPDFIPLVGKLDDGLAYIILTVGIWSIFIGLIILLHPLFQYTV